MGILTRKDFLIGVLVGYALLVVFPQLNIRNAAAKKAG
jgi:hypothetical protein